jgi:Transposase DDE domain
VAAPTLLDLITPPAFPRLVTIFADQKYHNHALDTWMAEHRAGWRIEVKVRPAGTRGFTPLGKRWVIERTNAWHGRYRRNSKDDERTTESSTAMIKISHIHQYLRQKRRRIRAAEHGTAMRQGSYAACRIWIPQPNSTQGATAHAGYYGLFRDYSIFAGF